MNEITKKILKLLEENKIDKENMLPTLYESYKELELNLWEHYKTSPSIFYNLKDIVWFNLEHLPNGGEEKGLSDLRFLGKEFPFFIYCCNGTDTISIDDLPKLVAEIEIILSKWDKKWRLVDLYTKSAEGWHGGDEPSKLIIYDRRTESPSRYGYNTSYGNILGANGKTIKKLSDDIVLCALDMEIGEYVQGQILYNALLQFKSACKRAIEEKKDIKIDFEQKLFDY